MSMCQAVPNAMCPAAASTSPTPSGMRMSWDGLQVTFSAYAPPEPMPMNQSGASQSDSRPVRQ